MGTAVSVIGLSAVSIMAGPPAEQSAQPDRIAQTAPAPEAMQPPSEAAQPPAQSETPSVTPEPEATEAELSDTAEDQPAQDQPVLDQTPDRRQEQTPDQAPPDTATVEVPAGSVFNTTREDQEAVLPRPDTAPDTAQAPALSGQSSPTVAALPQADRDPAATPLADQSAESIAAPSIAIDAPTPVPMAESSAPRSAAPAEPQSPAPREADARRATSIPIISTGPDQPDQAQAAADEGPSSDAPRRPFSGGVAESPSAPAEEQTGMAALSPLPTPEPAPRRQALPVIEPSPPAVMPDQTGPTAPVAVPDMAPATRPSIGRPATSLVDRPAPATEAEAEPTGPDTPFHRNAVPFDDPEGRPRLSIILIDRGDSVIDASALQDFPYPLTFAVDAARPDAEEAAARYRDAGFEVMALVDLDPESTPQDAEIAIEASLAAVPDAVAVMEGDATGFQARREVADQVTAILLDRGYGLVMMPNGLNTAQKLAAKNGVPSATVFRDFDGAGQDAAAIRRFLDQGAFKAGQREAIDGTEDESVIMMGRLRPDTISALLLWGLQDRARRVALAPVSAVLGGTD
ncbi:MAG: divergent polysaccharide deacetylase family protein [Rhodobacterales bacterium]